MTVRSFSFAFGAFNWAPPTKDGFCKILGIPCCEKVLFLRSSSNGRPELPKVVDQSDIDSFFSWPSRIPYRRWSKWSDKTSLLGGFCVSWYWKYKKSSLSDEFSNSKGHFICRKLVQHQPFAWLCHSVFFPTQHTGTTQIGNYQCIDFPGCIPRLETNGCRRKKDTYYTLNIANLIFKCLSMIHGSDPGKFNRHNISPFDILWQLFRLLQRKYFKSSYTLRKITSDTLIYILILL